MLHFYNEKVLQITAIPIHISIDAHPVIDAAPRMVMYVEAPGVPDELVTVTPAVRPEIAFTMSEVLDLEISSESTD